MYPNRGFKRIPVKYDIEFIIDILKAENIPCHGHYSGGGAGFVEVREQDEALARSIINNCGLE